MVCCRRFGVGKVNLVFKMLITIIIFGISSLSFVSNSKVLLNRYKLYSVISDSMRPTISKGSLIVVDTSDKNITPEKVLTFKYPVNFSRTITHRVVEHVTESDYDYWVTKGDNNNTNDPFKVTQDLIIGTYVFKVPILGLVIKFVHEPFGLILIVIIPAIIIVYKEIEVTSKIIKAKINQTLRRRLIRSKIRNTV